MSDLELLYQEQLESIVEDLAQHQAAERKGKAVVTDPPLRENHTSIMALEGNSGVPDSSRPDELITIQPEGGSSWLVQHMPHSGRIARGGSIQVNRQSDTPSTSMLADSEEEAPVDHTTTATEQKAESVTELSEVSVAKSSAVSVAESARPSVVSAEHAEVSSAAEQTGEVIRTEAARRGYRNS